MSTSDMYIPVPVPQPGQPQMPVQYPGQPMMAVPYGTGQPQMPTQNPELPESRRGHLSGSKSHDLKDDLPTTFQYI
jgi:hypothetical protein